jgi:protein-arginine kinase activator protein McsA
MAITKPKSKRLICEECKKSFRPYRSDQRFCSASCRQKAYRRRVMFEALIAETPLGKMAGWQHKAAKHG